MLNQPLSHNADRPVTTPAHLLPADGPRPERISGIGAVSGRRTSLKREALGKNSSCFLVVCLTLPMFLSTFDWQTKRPALSPSVRPTPVGRTQLIPEDQLRKHTVQALRRSSPIFGGALFALANGLPVVMASCMQTVLDAQSRQAAKGFASDTPTVRSNVPSSSGFPELSYINTVR